MTTRFTALVISEVSALKGLFKSIFLLSVKICPFDAAQVRLLARSLYEIRLLLGDYLGSDNPAALHLREAAHLSYALHNEALAISEGREFDLQAAIAKIEAIKRVIPEESVSSRVLSSM